MNEPAISLWIRKGGGGPAMRSCQSRLGSVSALWKMRKRRENEETTLQEAGVERRRAIHFAAVAMCWLVLALARAETRRGMKCRCGRGGNTRRKEGLGGWMRRGGAEL